MHELSWSEIYVGKLFARAFDCAHLDGGVLVSTLVTVN